MACSLDGLFRLLPHKIIKNLLYIIITFTDMAVNFGIKRADSEEICHFSGNLAHLSQIKCP
jgi:hypothetical protein